MRFYIDSTVYTNAQNDILLDDLIRLVQENRHDWVFKNIMDVNNIEASSWYQGFGTRLGSFVLKTMQYAYKNKFYNKKKEDITIVEPKQSYTPTEYPLVDALILLRENVKIILENAEYDTKFINALLDNFPALSTSIKTAKAKRWLEYLHAGGTGSIVQLINQQLNRFDTEALPPRKYIRLFVLVDSDKENPYMDLPKVQKNIKKTCEDNNICYHILYKREMENYLPLQVLIHLPKHIQNVVTNYAQLDENQKDFYDSGEGFKKIKNEDAFIDETGKKTLTNQDKYSPEQIDLYKTLSDSLYENLKTGFKGIKPKKKLPELFTHPTITQANLKARCAHQPPPYSNELEDILTKISALL